MRPNIHKNNPLIFDVSFYGNPILHAYRDRVQHITLPESLCRRKEG